MKSLLIIIIFLALVTVCCADWKEDVEPKIKKYISDVLPTYYGSYFSYNYIQTLNQNEASVFLEELNITTRSAERICDSRFNITGNSSTPGGVHVELYKIACISYNHMPYNLSENAEGDAVIIPSGFKFRDFCRPENQWFHRINNNRNIFMDALNEVRKKLRNGVCDTYSIKMERHLAPSGGIEYIVIVKMYENRRRDRYRGWSTICKSYLLLRNNVLTYESDDCNHTYMYEIYL